MFNMAGTPGFIAKDINQGVNRFLECSLQAFNGYAPSLSITIREGNNNAYSFVDVTKIPALIAMVQNPMSATPLTVRGTLTRRGTDFIVTSPNNNSSLQVTLSDEIFQNFILYLNSIYQFAPIIKEIVGNIRMVLAQCFNQAGFGGVTSYWIDKGGNQQQQQQQQQQPPMGMPPQPPMMQPQTGMPPMGMPPMGMPQQQPQMGMPPQPPMMQSPMGGVPAAPTQENFMGGMQNLLGNAFPNK